MGNEFVVYNDSQRGGVVATPDSISSAKQQALPFSKDVYILLEQGNLEEALIRARQEKKTEDTTLFATLLSRFSRKATEKPTKPETAKDPQSIRTLATAMQGARSAAPAPATGALSTLHSVVMSIIRGIYQGGKAVSSTVTTIVVQVKAVVLSPFKQLAELAKGLLLPLDKALKNLQATLFSATSFFMKAVATSIQKTLTAFLDPIQQLASFMRSRIEPVANWVAQNLQMLQARAEAGFAFVKRTFKPVVSAIAAAGNWINTKTGDSLRYALEQTKAKFEPLARQIQSMADKVKSAIAMVMATTAALAKAIPDQIAFASLWVQQHPAVKATQGSLRNLYKAAVRFFEKGQQGFMKAAKFFEPAFNRVVAGVRHVAGWIEILFNKAFALWLKVWEYLVKAALFLKWALFALARLVRRSPHMLIGLVKRIGYRIGRLTVWLGSKASFK